MSAHIQFLEFICNQGGWGGGALMLSCLVILSSDK